MQPLLAAQSRRGIEPAGRTGTKKNSTTESYIHGEPSTAVLDRERTVFLVASSRINPAVNPAATPSVTSVIHHRFGLQLSAEKRDMEALIIDSIQSDAALSYLRRSAV